MSNATTQDTDAPQDCALAAGAGLTAEQSAALKDASTVLRTEANELATYMEHTLKTKLTLRTQEILSIDAMTPHRVVIAVRNEMERLRSISDTLLAMIPKPLQDDDDE